MIFTYIFVKKKITIYLRIKKNKNMVVKGCFVFTSTAEKKTSSICLVPR